jgi:hypothetical protein
MQAVQALPDAAPAMQHCAESAESAHCAQSAQSAHSVIALARMASAITYHEPSIQVRDALYAVSRNGYAIEHLSAELRTPEVCMAAVIRNPHAIRFLRPEERTWDVRMMAVHQFGWAIEHLSAEQRTPALCVEALRQDPGTIRCLSPEETQHPEVATEIRAQWPRIARRLGPHLAQALADRILRDDPSATTASLWDVGVEAAPTQHAEQDPAEATPAINADSPTASAPISAPISPQLTPFSALESVRRDGWAIQFLQAHERTPAVCLEAVRSCGRAIMLLSAEQRSVEVCLAAVAQDPRALSHLSPSERTPAVCIRALEGDITVLSLLQPEELDTDGLVAAWVRGHWTKAVDHLPEQVAWQVARTL